MAQDWERDRRIHLPLSKVRRLPLVPPTARVDLSYPSANADEHRPPPAARSGAAGNLERRTPNGPPRVRRAGRRRSGRICWQDGTGEIDARRIVCGSRISSGDRRLSDREGARRTVHRRAHLFVIETLERLGGCTWGRLRTPPSGRRVFPEDTVQRIDVEDSVLRRSRSASLRVLARNARGTTRSPDRTFVRT